MYTVPVCSVAVAAPALTVKQGDPLSVRVSVPPKLPQPDVSASNAELAIRFPGGDGRASAVAANERGTTAQTASAAARRARRPNVQRSMLTPIVRDAERFLASIAARRAGGNRGRAGRGGCAPRILASLQAERERRPNPAPLIPLVPALTRG